MNSAFFKTICLTNCLLFLFACNDSPELNLEFLNVDIAPLSAKLTKVADCDELVSAYRQRLIRKEQIKAHSQWFNVPWLEDTLVFNEPADALAEDEAAGSGNEYSETNVQEAGVDEADLAKTDGDELFVVSDQKLLRFDVSDAASPIKTGSSALGFWATGLYFTDSRVVVMGNKSISLYDRETFELIEKLSLSKADQIYSHIVDSRRIENNLYVTASIYLNFERDYYWEYLDEDELDDVSEDFYKSAYRDAVAKAYAANKKRITNLGRKFLLPQVKISDKNTSSQPEPVCDNIYVPTQGGTAGLALVYKINIDSASNFSTTGVLLNTQHLYLNQDALYIAGSDDFYFDWDSAQTEKTGIYRFDITDDGLSAPAGGIIPGFILNPYSMSHYEGNLRVATTQDRWFDSSNNMFVLGKENGFLKRLGEVRNIAKTERIYSARFYDEWGYIVTFRETDPLYVFDLSEPDNPQITGELKIPGFATHIQKLDENRLLTIGRGDTWGSQQLQIINVADKTNPFREDVYGLGTGWSEAFYDPHAFLYYKPLELLVVPFGGYYNDNYRNSFEAFGFTGSDSIAFDHLESIDFDTDYANSPRRSVIIGDYMYGIGTTALKVFEADKVDFDLVTTISY